MKRILVPLDGSPMSESALSSAYFLAGSMGAEVLLLHVVEKSAPDEIHGERHLTNAVSAKAYLDGIVAAAPDSIAFTCHVHDEASPDAAVAIAEHVDELRSDLVVLATHGKNRFGRFLHGSVAQRAVFRGGVPILTIPSECGYALSSCGTVAVATEGAGGHGVPSVEVSTLARALGACVKLVLVVDERSSLKAGAASFARARPATAAATLAATVLAAGEYLHEAALDPAFTGLDVDYRVLRGSPDRALSAYSKSLGGALFVVQTHGRSGLDAFWDGSAASRIVARLRCPVLLVPSDRIDEAR